MATCVGFQILLLGVIFPKLRVLLNEREAGLPPDIRFGYSASELNVWYDAIGIEGCKSYRQLAMLDIFPYMESYTLVLGALLVNVARRASVSEQIALLAPLTMMFDVIETLIPAYGCFLYPDERLSTELIQVSSLANQLKWVIFGFSLILSVVLFAMSKMKPAVDANKKE